MPNKKRYVKKTIEELKELQFCMSNYEDDLAIARTIRYLEGYLRILGWKT